jgi:hypothetical protein
MALFKTNAENQRHIDLIFERLRKAAIGDLVTYANLNDLIGGDVTKRDRYKLDHARRIIKGSDQYDFDVVRRVGLKRLNDSEIIGTTAVSRKKIHRAVRRANKRLEPIDVNGLSNEDLIRYSAEVSLTGVLITMTDPRRMKTIRARVTLKNGKLDLQETLKLFR